MSNRMSWYAVAASDDVAGLKNKGFCITDDGEILYNEQYEYALARMYISDGHGIVDVETSNFFFDKDESDRITINAIEPMTTPVKSYKIRMTDKYPGAQWFYFSPDQEDVLLAADTWMYLYEPDGTPAQDIYYRGMELEALNPIQSEDYEYSRFNGVEFGFRQHGGVGQLSIKFDSVVDNTGDEWPYGKRIRVLVTEPTPSLPTVSATWLVITAGTGNVNIPTNDEHVGYWWDDDSQSYVSAVWNSDVTYGMIAFYTTPFAYAGRMELEIKEVSGTVGVHNVSSSTVTVAQANIAVCSSPDATVITVYDSSNNPYNAFKYTSDGTDYYYVLDGTQTDWTDDLASIGYSDQLLIRGWMKADKSSVTLNAGEWTNWQLLNDSGSILYVDTSKTYTLHSPKSGTMKINKSVSGELYYEGTPSETIIVSDVIISVS